MQIDQATAIAERVKAQLAPHCDRIEIAGSIRRRKADVGDIEIVAIPKPYDVGLFSAGIAPIVSAWPKVRGELPCKYTQRTLPDGIALDLFFALPLASCGCGMVLSLSDVTTIRRIEDEVSKHGPTQEKLRCLREILRGKKSVRMQQGLRNETAMEKRDAPSGQEVSDTDLQNLWEDVHLSGILEGKKMLFPGMHKHRPCTSNDRAQGMDQQGRDVSQGRVADGVQPEMGNPEGRVHVRAPGSYVGTHEAQTGTLGDRTSPERGQDGQPNRESGIDDAQASSRDGGMSALLKTISHRMSVHPVCPLCLGRGGWSPNWGLIYAIRTGSADYSHRVLACGWVRNGYKSADGMLSRDGVAVPVREERDLFRLAGVPWVDPEERSLNSPNQ